MALNMLKDDDGNSDKPRKPWDFVVVILIGIACVPFVLGNIVLLCNRKYRPVKTKSVYLTVLSSVGGLICVMATIVVNNHLGRTKDSIWALCSLWTFWLQACFGFSLWLNCLNVRLMVLYSIFVSKKGAKTFKSNLIRLCGLLLPSIIFCTWASVKKPNKFRVDPLPPGSPPGTPGNCKFDGDQWHWLLGLVSLLVVYLLIFLVLAFILRSKAMAQYNEFRLIRNGGVMQLFNLLLFMVTVQTQAYKQVIGRSFMSLSIASAVFYYFWARNGEVIYNVIFHKEEYARKFNDDMNRCPSERDIRENFPPSFQNLETNLKEARESINHYENQIKQIEEEISTMEEKITDLQEQVDLNGKPLVKLSEKSKSLVRRIPSYI